MDNNTQINMKTFLKYGYSLLAILAITGIVAFSTGCAGEQVTATTNPTTGVVTLVTNYVPNTAATQVGVVAQTTAPIIGATVPQPYGGAAALGVGLLGLLATSIASGIAAYKNAQANLHQSTLQAVVTGIESSIPDIQTALTTTATSGVVSTDTTKAINTANSVLSAVKGSITSATIANGTAINLNKTLATAGVGPTAA